MASSPPFGVRDSLCWCDHQKEGSIRIKEYRGRGTGTRTFLSLDTPTVASPYSSAPRQESKAYDALDLAVRLLMWVLHRSSRLHGTRTEQEANREDSEATISTYRFERNDTPRNMHIVVLPQTKAANGGGDVSLCAGERRAHRRAGKAPQGDIGTRRENRPARSAWIAALLSFGRLIREREES